MIATKPLCASSSNLADMFAISERMNPIGIGSQRSKFKVTIGMYGNKLVNKLETKQLCASSMNLADMLTMLRE